ncbi:MFS transporter [Alicyclobacillus macrosporangiidus]|uniref:MFS transporter n=1 Tax=Alicyclobacillus macrosporangiidus TaxID=392015 RepID=UPI00068C027B|nr:MFS transporter [Alicyclobacillus macrosporangiidus]
MSIFLDTTPLRTSPAFRRLWLGQGLSVLGGYMTTFAVTLQLYNLTHSSLAVGAAGLCSALPAMAFVLLGGSIGDAVDRRILVLSATSGQMAVSILFALQAFAALRIPALLYGLLVLQSLLTAVNAPARRTFLPRLLPKDQIRAGNTLNMVVMRFAEMAGPALAGVIASVWGLKACYTLDAFSFTAALYGVGRLPAMPPEGGPSRPTLRSAAEGLRFLIRQPVLMGAFFADLSVTVLGVSTALLPALNAARFGGNPQTLGLLMGATGVGGLAGSIFSGPLRRVSREGLAVLVVGALWGGCIALLGASGVLWLALACLFVAGAADTMLVVLRTTIVQVNTPDAYRGRVSGIDYLVGAAGPQLGNLRAGLMGTVFPVGVALVIADCPAWRGRWPSGSPSLPSGTTGPPRRVTGRRAHAEPNALYPLRRRRRGIGPPVPAPRAPTSRRTSLRPNRMMLIRSKTQTSHSPANGARRSLCRTGPCR